MGYVHIWFPKVFPEAASYPYLDALTTIMSFVAMWLMVRKHIESWLYWIAVDVIGIWLYFTKDVKFISLLYVMLLFMAIRGFLNWISVKAKTPDNNWRQGKGPRNPKAWSRRRENHGFSCKASLTGPLSGPLLTSPNPEFS